MGIHKEVWTGELVRKFTHEGTFLQAVPDYSRYVDNNVIHLVDAGAKPEVLINNTTYPIAIQELADSDIAIGLDKFQTKATPITDDELHAISYKKIEHVITSHRESLQETTGDKAIHAFAPAAPSAETPVLKSTGAVRANGQKRLLVDDIIALKEELDKLKIPDRERNLVLSKSHVADLLMTDETFKAQYKDIRSGEVLDLFGFKLHSYINNPKYTIDGTTGAINKVAFGAALAGGEVDASVFFYGPHMFKCKGDAKRYYSEAEKDPEYQRNLVNFRLYFMALPKVNLGTGAIISGK